MSVHHVETNPVGFDDWDALHDLLQAAFAYMAGRIDPPSSLSGLGSAELAAKAKTEDLFLVRVDGRPVACAFGRAMPDAYYIGKLTAAAQHRGVGMGRALVTAARMRAKALELPALELQSRIELTELHGFFRRMGFDVTGSTAHPGYARPTSLTFRHVID